MSSIPYNQLKENEIFDFVSKFISEFQIGKFLFQCNAGKEKGIPVMTIFRYLKCWDIEVFFKSCKSYLKLVKECRSISYNALNAHVAIVFTRYMLLSVAKRRNEDDKTICELFYCLMDELADITFSQSMQIIMEALLDTVMEFFHITEAQLEEFTSSFINHLPKYMQDALRGTQVVV